MELNRAPLIPLPIVEEPFARVAMDIVGPLQKSGRGHRFILTLMDYATKHPEAVPLRRVDDLDEEIITPLAQAQGQPELSSSLSTQQRAELYCLLDEMSDVFSDVPGTVDSVEHCIDTGEAPPFRVPPYRIPKVRCIRNCRAWQSLALWNCARASGPPQLYSATGFESTMACFWCFCVF